MKVVDIFLGLLAFFWMIVFISYFPFPINWLLLANVTLVSIIYTELRGLK